MPFLQWSLRVHALSVIANPHPEFPLPVFDFDFDPARLCMLERVAHGFDRNSVGLVAGQWSEWPRFALNVHTEVGAILSGFIDCKFLSECADRAAKVGHARRA